eukprot:tig00020553_g10751.t1
MAAGSSVSPGGANSSFTYGVEGCSYVKEADGTTVNNTANCGTCYSDKSCTTALTGTYHRNACMSSSSGLSFKNSLTNASCVAFTKALDDEIQVADETQEAEYEYELEAVDADLLADSALDPMISEIDFSGSE